ncbi:preprotein translocase subunit SecE [Bifidobacterium favimelis]|uniref:Protein translocase subunit SecE n=1 Tax=Bifidobacterium favimelis TaxID=3122979 RepID=A0ABU8ZM69_9BIFI
MAKAKDDEKKEPKPNFFMRIGLFIKQVIDELRKVVTPTGKELLSWSVAVFIFVLLLMVFVTILDFGLGKLVFLIFG